LELLVRRDFQKGLLRLFLKIRILEVLDTNHWGFAQRLGLPILSPSLGGSIYNIRKRLFFNLNLGIKGLPD